MRRTLWVMALGLPVLFMPLEAQSFWSMWGFNVHQQITTEALTADFSVGSKPLRFEVEAKVALEKSVQLPDDEEKRKYDATDHFDSDSFVGSLRVLKKRRGDLVSLLSGDNPYARQNAAWTEFGLMLHAIQDFYSHSTWVRVHSDGIAGFATLTSTAAVLPGWTNNALSGGDCLADKVTYVRTPGKITTGYWDPPADDDPNTADHPPVPTPGGKCDHGPVKGGWASNCLRRSKSNFGLALDSQCSVPSDALSLHLSARQRAVTETREFTQAIIKQLVDAGKVEGACALLGVSLTRCPSDLPACGSTAQSTQWESAFRYAITQNDGISSNETVGVGGGRSSNAVSLDLTSGSPPRLRLRTAYGLDAFHVSLSVRTTAPYQDGVLSYQLEAPGEELWNSINLDGCLNAEFVPSSYQRRGCFQFTGTLNVVGKTTICTRDGLLFSTLEVGYEGNSPLKHYGSTSLGPVKADRGYAKGVFVECLRGVPTPNGARGLDEFACSPDEGPPVTPSSAH
jgi:hypothetical protein